MQLTGAPIQFTGSPNCPTVHTTGNTESFAVLIKWSLMMWLPEWYYVEVSYYNGSIAEVYNSTLKGSASFNVTSLQPGTVYNISVIPCNMAGCNKSCDVYSVQTMTRGEMVECIVQLKQQMIILGVNTASIVYTTVLVFMSIQSKEMHLDQILISLSL